MLALRASRILNSHVDYGIQSASDLLVFEKSIWKKSKSIDEIGIPHVCPCNTSAISFNLFTISCSIKFCSLKAIDDRDSSKYYGVSTLFAVKQHLITSRNISLHLKVTCCKHGPLA